MRNPLVYVMDLGAVTAKRMLLSMSVRAHKPCLSVGKVLTQGKLKRISQGTTRGVLGVGRSDNRPHT